METPADLLRRVVEALETAGVPYAIGGSMASIAYGEPRATRDIDVVVDLAPADVPPLADRFPAEDFYLDRDAAADAADAGGQFNVIHPDSGFKIDFFVAGDAVERSQLDRARRLAAVEGLEARFSPPEELIVKKLQYHDEGGSDKHLRDIAAILDVSGETIELDRVRRLAAEIGVEQTWSELLARWRETRGSCT